MPKEISDAQRAIHQAQAVLRQGAPRGRGVQRFEFQRGWHPKASGTGDNDPSGFAGMTNKGMEDYLAEQLENGFEPIRDPRGGIKFRRMKAVPSPVTPDRSAAIAKAMNKFRKLHPDIEMGDLPGSVDPRMLSDLLGGFHDMMVKYPHGRIRSMKPIRAGLLGPDRNVADPWWGVRAVPENPFQFIPEGSSDVELSPGYLNDFEKSNKMFQKHQKDHWVSQAKGRNAGYYTALHEFGRVLDHRGSGAARSALNTELRKHFVSLHPETKGMGRLEIDGAYSDWLHDQVPESARDNVEIWAGKPWHEGKPWVGKKPKVKLREPAALAEGFADVEMNGDNATDASKFLHQRLVEMSQPQPVSPPPTRRRR